MPRGPTPFAVLLLTSYGPDKLQDDPGARRPGPPSSPSGHPRQATAYASTAVEVSADSEGVDLKKANSCAIADVTEKPPLSSRIRVRGRRPPTCSTRQPCSALESIELDAGGKVSSSEMNLLPLHDRPPEERDWRVGLRCSHRRATLRYRGPASASSNQRRSPGPALERNSGLQTSSRTNNYAALPASTRTACCAHALPLSTFSSR